MAVFGRYPLPLDNEPQVEHAFLVYEHNEGEVSGQFSDMLPPLIMFPFLGFTGNKSSPLMYICYMTIKWLMLVLSQ